MVNGKMISKMVFYLYSEFNIQGNGTYYYHKSGNVYEGQWSLDKRSGYGTLSIRVKQEVQKPTTDANSFILDLERQKKNKKDATSSPLRKVYAGEWANDKRHGLGTCFYENGDIYHGHWEFDMKEGWGQMQYLDGSVYEGEFHQEKRHGQGILLLGKDLTFLKTDTKPTEIDTKECGSMIIKKVLASLSIA